MVLTGARPPIGIRAATLGTSSLSLGEPDLQQCAELFDGETGVADDTAHRDRIHGIVHSVQVIDAGDLGQS